MRGFFFSLEGKGLVYDIFHMGGEGEFSPSPVPLSLKYTYQYMKDFAYDCQISKGILE